MQPFNYSLAPVNPTQNFLQGVQTQDALRNRTAQMQQQQFQMQQQQQMQYDLGELSAKENPTTQDYIRIATKYPELGKNFKDLLSNLSTEQRQNKISGLAQTLAALQSGNGDTAYDLIMSNADALRNSGDTAGAKAAEAMAQTAKLNPRVAINSISTLLASEMGPEKFDSTFKTLFTVPQEAANAPTKFALENQNAVEDIEGKRLKRQIDVLDAQIRGTDSETKRGELNVKRDELLAKQAENAEKRQVTANDTQSKLDTITQSLDTVDRVLNSPLMADKVIANRTGPGTVYYGITKSLPGTDATDFEALIDPLRAQQFTTAISQMKGMGALSDAEGKKLERAVASLDTNQSKPALISAIKVIKGTLERAQQKAIGSGKLPTSTKDSGGGTYLFKSPKYGNITDAIVNKALEDNPGLTREQAIQFFRGQ